MNKDTFLKEHYGINENTGLICPVCQDGKLVINEKNITKIEYKKFNKDVNEYAKQHNECDYDWFKYSFYGFLVCKNCSENVVFAGKLSEYFDLDDAFYTLLTIEYIERPPYIIEINNNIPKEIKCPLTEILIDSFKLFWIDVNSCANKIRICLEFMMDDLFKIQKSETVRNKKTGLNERKKLTLHKRINLLSDKSMKEILESVKWIGNSASHKETINKEDLLDAYAALEYVLNKLYDGGKEIIKNAKLINKTKKPRSKITTRRKSQQTLSTTPIT